MNHYLINLNLSFLIILLLSGCGSDVKESGLASKATASLHFDLVELFMKSKSYEAASPVARKLNQEHPHDPRPVYYLGVILRERKAFENAEKYLLEALKREPTFTRAYDALGILYGMQNRLKDSLIAHAKAVELAPKNAQYWHNLGFALTLAKRYDESIKAYQEAISIAPEEKRLYQSIGITYGVKGAYQEAYQMLTQTLSPTQAWMQLAEIQERRGDLPQAQKSLQEVLRLTPLHKKAETALLRVKSSLNHQNTSADDQTHKKDND